MPLRCAAALTVAGTLAAFAAGAAGAVRVDARASAAVRSPTAYLLAAQNRDGGFGAAPGQRSSTLYSGWAALGLAAKGHNPGAVSHGGPSLLSYIERHVGTDAASLERTILVARAAGVPATQFGGHDLVAALDRDINADGSVRHKVDLTTFAVLALRAAGVAAPPRTIRWLIRQQNRNGGFSYATAGAKADVDDTGAALEAIAGQRPRRDPACGPLYPRDAESRWRLSVPARRCVQRPVHRLGGPGVDRRASRSVQGAPPRLAVAAALPQILDHAQWCDQLCASHIAHAGVGHGRGGDGARRQVAPACPDPTRVAWGWAVAVPGAVIAAQTCRTCPRGSSA